MWINILVLSVILVLFVKGNNGSCKQLYDFCECGEWDKCYPYLFVGEYLEMNCSLNKEIVEHGDNSSKLNIIFGNDNPVPENETFIVNNSTLGMRSLITSTFKEPYYCLLDNPVYAKDYVVDTTWVETEYPPQPVTNLSCIIYDWDQAMECTWDLGVKYRDLKNIETALTLASSGLFVTTSACPNQQLLNCTWKEREATSFNRNNLAFSVITTNTKRNVSNKSDWITFSQQDIVKPIPVDYLYARTVSSQCIMLEWEHFRKYRQKIYIMSVSSKWNDNQVIETEDSNVTVCDLEPNTKYEFTIVTRPGKNQGFPSNPVFNHSVTYIDIPDQSPEVSNGAYFVENIDSTNNQRNVTLYWKELPEIYQNGPMVGYNIKVIDSDGKLHENVETSHLYRSLILPYNQEVTVYIKSKNNAGYSLEPSIIYIPKAKDLSKPNKIIVEAQNSSIDTMVVVSWEKPDIGDVTSYTVYYCQYDTECTNEIEWVEAHNTSVMISNIQFDRKYKFGVSVNRDRFSSGFEWETCYYLKGKGPSPPSSVEVRAYPENAITVNWQEPPCGESPYITNHRITWCPTTTDNIDCPNQPMEKEIPSTGEPGGFVINDLSAGTTYGVRVQFVTEDGRISGYSEMVYAQPTNNDLLQSEIIGIAVGGVFLFMLAIAGALFLYKRTSVGLKKIQKPYKIDPVKIQKKELGKEYTTQTSKDSGKSSMSSDILQLPTKDKSSDLFPVAEESSSALQSDDGNRKYDRSSSSVCSRPQNEMVSYVKIEDTGIKSKSLSFFSNSFDDLLQDNKTLERFITENAEDLPAIGLDNPGFFKYPDELCRDETLPFEDENSEKFDQESTRSNINGTDYVTEAVAKSMNLDQFNSNRSSEVLDSAETSCITNDEFIMENNYRGSEKFDQESTRSNINGTDYVTEEVAKSMNLDQFNSNRSSEVSDSAKTSNISRTNDEFIMGNNYRGSEKFDQESTRLNTNGTDYVTEAVAKSMDVDQFNSNGSSEVSDSVEKKNLIDI